MKSTNLLEIELQRLNDMLEENEDLCGYSKNEIMEQMAHVLDIVRD